MVQFLLSELCKEFRAKRLTAVLAGEDRLVSAVNTLKDANKGDISFLANPKYIPALKDTQASAVIVGNGTSVPERLSTIRSDDPYAAITIAITKIHGYRKHPQWGIGEGSNIDPSATIGERANIACGVTISADVSIGNDCTIYPGCYLGDGVRLGEDCVLYPNVVVYDGCVFGNRVTIHAGSVIGEDGMGYAPRDKKWWKIPQIGQAVLGDDVEIGANCTIDRATLGHTEIGSGTKLGNSVLIAHGSKIGPDCLFVGQVGVAGSTTIGRHVTLAGQVGVKGHLTIGDDVRVGGQSGVGEDVEEGAEMFGSPAVPVQQAIRSIHIVQKLPEWVERIKDLERQVKVLQSSLESRDKCD